MDFCDDCGLPAAPHAKDDCFKELVRKRKLGDAMFDAAIALVHDMGDPVDPKNASVSDRLVALDLATWRWAV
jgi:hypothetical protein